MKTRHFFYLVLLAVFVLVHRPWFIKTSAPVAPTDHSKIIQTPELKRVSFSDLPGWNKADPLLSLQAFQASCRSFLKQPPEASVGNDRIKMSAQDWHPVCKEALSLKTTAPLKIRAFFEAWFTPVTYYDKTPMKGLFTGYYFPTFEGSFQATETYKVPIYGLPKDRVTVRLRDFDSQLENRTLVGRIAHHQLRPYYTRAEIDSGALLGKAPIVAWVKSPIDRLFIEIQGSGTLKLPDGSEAVLGYAGGNGAAYTPIARVLIDKGVMTKDTASMQKIRSYLEAHPEEMDTVIHQNKSFVFFRLLPQKGALGSQGLLLTPGYSLAVDRSYVPLGLPIWLNTRRPDVHTNETHPFNRLMIAQDTGGAIRGAVRGDVYWGAGVRATEIAGKMKNEGQYWLLLPKTHPLG